MLRRELDSDDPWQLDSNPFELERHWQMLRLSLAGGPITNALEVGCAGGAFTEKLAPYCQRLTVIDVIPQAIARTRERLKQPANAVWVLADVKNFSTQDKFDLIVVAEVFYYLSDLAEARTAIRNLSRMLASNGQLVFGSARDANCQRWGHVAGAETVLALLREELTEIERVECVGQSPNEDCLLARFRKTTFSSHKQIYPC
ncbi:nodulation methyltransferase NodS [Cupriavidus consociatus]|uniref:nodulation methyltransferase NodS n=1 Tax=Cupriavidus consociatus TaxID=2821357 RepID=UPI002475E677|nr:MULTISPECIES: nodulation methyltransferase NodS [unclassified Cupriavidus]MDK2661892.1 nodulation methyltransferase NodS [Cupriavidus sp. LEh21]